MRKELEITDFVGVEIENELASKGVKIDGYKSRVRLVMISNPAEMRVEYTVQHGVGFFKIYKANEFKLAIEEYNNIESN